MLLLLEILLSILDDFREKNDFKNDFENYRSFVVEFKYFRNFKQPKKILHIGRWLFTESSWLWDSVEKLENFKQPGKNFHIG